MSITNIESIKQLIVTAQAAYGDLAAQYTSQTLTKTAGFTDKEAAEFISQYELVNQQGNTSEGFSATVFKDKNTNIYVLAIRGTEPDVQWGVDLTHADFGDIKDFGYAARQAVDLYRYWKKLTSPARAPIVYSTDEINRLYMLSNSVTSLLNIVYTSIEYLTFVNSFSNDTGLGKVPAGAKVDVTGHSLGGNLAYVFASMFPDNVNQVVTLNGPGVRTDGQLRLSAIGFSSIDNSKITSVDAEGDSIHALSIIQQGKVVDISQEVGHGTNDGFYDNHLAVNGVDSLTLMNLFSKLDPSQANNPSGILKDIMRSSSNTAIDTYENMLDSLRRILLGNSISSTPLGTQHDLQFRQVFYNYMDDLAKKFAQGGTLNYLVGQTKFVKVADDQGESAKGDFGQFLALYYLTPFALQAPESVLKNLNPDLYQLWMTDDLSRIFSTDDKKMNFSDTWYRDRAEVSERLIARNIADDEVDHKNPNGHIINVNDIGTGIGIQFTSDPGIMHGGPGGGTQIPTVNMLFDDDANRPLLGNQNEDHIYGGDGNDTLKGEAGFDYLEGNAGNDLIYGGDDADELRGGEGDDQLVGEGGSDILEGGKGNDTYSFTGQFGRDIIKDSDGIGSIEFSSVKLTQLTQSTKDSIVYYDDVNNPTKKAVVIDEGNTKSLIISTVTKTGEKIIDSGNSVTIKNWVAGNLGLTLNDAAAPVINTSNVVFLNGSDTNNVISGRDYLLNQSAQNIRWTVTPQFFSEGGAGRDLMSGTIDGSDSLNGGDGNDVILNGFMSGRTLAYANPFEDIANQGTDTINGGIGNDFIVVAGKNAVVHGNEDNDLIDADLTLRIGVDPAEYSLEDPNAPRVKVSRDDAWTDYQTYFNPEIVGRLLDYFDPAKDSTGFVSGASSALSNGLKLRIAA